MAHRHRRHASLSRHFETRSVEDGALGRRTARRPCRRDLDHLSSDARSRRFDKACVCSGSSVQTGSLLPVDVSEIAAYCLSLPDKPADFCDSGPTVIADSPWQIRVEFVVGRFEAVERDPSIMHPNPLPDDFFSATEHRMHITVLGDAVPGSPFAPLFLGADEIGPANCEFHASYPVIFAGEGGSVGDLIKIRDRFGNNIRPASLVERISGNLTLLTPYDWTPIEDKPAELTPTWLFTNWFISMQVDCYVAGQYRLNIDYAQDNDTSVPIPIRLSNGSTLQPSVTVECAPGKLHSISLERQGEAALGSEVTLVAQAYDSQGNAAYFGPAVRNDTLVPIEEQDIDNTEVLIEHESCSCTMLSSLDVELMTERPGCLSIRFSTETAGKHTIRILYRNVDYVQNPFAVELQLLQRVIDPTASVVDASFLFVIDNIIHLYAGEDKWFFVYLRDKDDTPTEGNPEELVAKLFRQDVPSQDPTILSKRSMAGQGIDGVYAIQIKMTTAAMYRLVVTYQGIEITNPYSTVIIYHSLDVSPERSYIVGSAIGIEIGREDDPQYDEPELYRQVAGRNMSLIVIAVDPYGNEHGSTKPGFTMNQEIISASSWMQVYEWGDGKTRFYFSIQTSGRYHLRTDLGTTLNYQAYLTVYPAEPVVSECRLFDMQSIVAGEEGYGFLYAEDRFRNVYDERFFDLFTNSLFDITLTHTTAASEDGPHSVVFTTYNTAMNAMQFRYNPTRAGEYNVRAMTQNSPIPGGGGTINVWISSIVSPERSFIVGSAIGIEIGREDDPQYDEPELYRQVAGTNMSLIVTAVDPYDNVHISSKPGFTMNQVIRSAAVSMQVYEWGDGKTRFYFSIQTSGTYYLKTKVGTALNYEAYLDVSPAEPLASNCRVFDLQLSAGEERHGFLQVQDRYRNVYDAQFSDMIDVTQFEVGLVHSTAVSVDDVQMVVFNGFNAQLDAVKFSYSLTQTGEYMIGAFFQNTPIQGNGDRFVVGFSSAVSPERSYIVGSATGIEIGREDDPQYARPEDFRQVAGLNMSLIVTAVDPYGNEHTSTKPGFTMNQEIVSAAAWMEVYEWGDGKTRFYFSIHRSGTYYLRTDFGTALNYEAYLDVSPAEPLASNCRVYDVHSVNAGEEGHGFLEVEDRFANVYDAQFRDMIDVTQFHITLTHSEATSEDDAHPVVFTEYNTQLNAMQFSYSLTQAGEYTISADYQNSPMQGNDDTFIVYPSIVISPELSFIVGSAIGIEVGREHHPQYARPEDFLQMAGLNMSLIVTAVDPYDNVHISSKPGFTMNQEITSAAAWMEVYEWGDGKTRFYFSIHRSGMYYLRTDLGTTLNYQAHLFVSPAEPLASNSRVFGVHSLEAGEEGGGFLEVEDRFANVYDTMFRDLIDVTQFHITLNPIAADSEDSTYPVVFTEYNTEQDAMQFRYSLTQAGEYTIAADYQNSSMQGDGDTFIVYPSSVVSPERSFIVGSAIGIEIGREDDIQYARPEDFRQVAGLNMSLIVTAVDPYDNVHITSKPGFTMNQVIRSAAAWMEVYEWGDGKTRFYFSIHISRTYYLKTKVGTALNYEAYLEVSPAEPLASNCRVLDVQSVNAGEDGEGFLQVQDRFANVYDAQFRDMIDVTQFHITLTHSEATSEDDAHPVVFTEYNTEHDAMRFRYSLTKSGEYTITADYQNSPMQGDGDTFIVWPSSVVSPERSFIVGSAIGIEVGREHHPQYARPEDFLQMAGLNMSLIVTAVDPYDNVHISSKPGFTMNQEIISAAAWMEVYEWGDGKTRFYFSIHRSGMYYLRTDLGTTLNYQAHLFVSPAEPLASNSRVFGVQSLEAGEEGGGFLEVEDRFANVYDTMFRDLIDVTQFHITLNPSSRDLEDDAQPVVFTEYNMQLDVMQFRYSLTQAGEYTIAADYQNSPMQGDGDKFVVYPSSVVSPERSFIVGSAIGVEIGREQYLRAEDYRQVAGLNMSFVITAVDPYGNVHISSKPGFTMNQEIVSAAAWMEVYEWGDGKTRFYFSIQTSGRYYLRTHLGTALNYHAYLEVSPAEPLASNCRIFDVQSVNAGDEGHGFLEVKDRFANVYDAQFRDMIDITQFHLTLIHTAANSNDGAQPVVFTGYNAERSAMEFHFNLTQSGKYRIAAVFQNSPIQGSGGALSIHASPVNYNHTQASDVVSDVVAGHGIEIRIVTRDFYGNIATEEEDLAQRTRINITRIATTEREVVNPTTQHEASNATKEHEVVNATSQHEAVNATKEHEAVNATSQHEASNATKEHEAVNATSQHEASNATKEHEAVNATTSIVEVYPGLLAVEVNLTTVGSYTFRVQIDGNDILSGNSSCVVHPDVFDAATSAIMLAANVPVGEWNDIMLLPMDRFRNVLAPLSNLSISTNATDVEIRPFGLADVGGGWMRAQYWLGSVGNFTLDVQQNTKTIWNFSITAVSNTSTSEGWAHTSMIRIFDALLCDFRLVYFIEYVIPYQEMAEQRQGAHHHDRLLSSGTPCWLLDLLKGLK